jgi:hypothetical protein
MLERFAAWFVTGPLGHLISALLDLWDAWRRRDAPR